MKYSCKPIQNTAERLMPKAESKYKIQLHASRYVLHVNTECSRKLQAVSTNYEL